MAAHQNDRGFSPDLRPEDDFTSVDPLDELLSSARWPEATSEQLCRLRQRWLFQSRVPRRARLALAAALVLVATGLALWQYRWTPDVRQDAGPALPIAEKRPAIERSAVERVADSDDVKDRDAVTPRMATGPPRVEISSPLELVLVQSAERRRAGRRDAQVEVEFRQRIQAAVDDLAVGKRTLEEVRDEFAPQAAGCEPLLTSLVAQSTGKTKHAGARLLAAIATPRALPTLLELAQSADLRGEAIAGIVRLAPPAVVARLALAEPDPALKRQLLAALLERGTRESVDLFLSLAGDPRSAEQAFGSLSVVARPPVDLLIESLQAAKVSRRLTAARVRGRLNDSGATLRLIAMAVEGQSRREALVALLSSSNPSARQFVDSGRHDLVWSAQLKAAGIDAQLPTTQYQEI
jgi:hypothetical protein